MKFVDDHGTEFTTAELASMVTMRGKLLQIAFTDISSFADLARDGNHDALAAAVIKTENDLISLFHTLNKREKREH